MAVEDVKASQRLGQFAGSLGFEVDYEQIPLGGKVDLNRDGLIVICGPRLSADVEGVLSTDPDLRFVELESGWALHDRTSGRTYKSGPDDDGQPLDVGYLGRLERPDGNGMLLVLTGIHPPGTLGVVDLLGNQLTELHRDARRGAFSVLVGVRYDADGEPESARLISPLHRHS